MLRDCEFWPRNAVKRGICYARAVTSTTIGHGTTMGMDIVYENLAIGTIRTDDFYRAFLESGQRGVYEKSMR